MPFNKETASINGRKGGFKTKERMLAKDPFYFERIGRISGEKRFKEGGSEVYQYMSVLSQIKKKQNKGRSA